MKATEFVKKFGLDVSIEAVKNMPNGWDYCCLRLPDFEFQKRVSSIADCVDMEDLKRLVESHELVQDYYGLARAKEHAESNYTAPELKAALKQAIADVEACKEVS